MNILMNKYIKSIPPINCNLYDLSLQFNPYKNAVFLEFCDFCHLP